MCNKLIKFSSIVSHNFFVFWIFSWDNCLFQDVLLWVLYVWNFWDFKHFVFWIHNNPFCVLISMWINDADGIETRLFSRVFKILEFLRWNLKTWPSNAFISDTVIVPYSIFFEVGLAFLNSCVWAHWNLGYHVICRRICHWK